MELSLVITTVPRSAIQRSPGMLSLGSDPHCTGARLGGIDGGQGRHVKNASYGRGLGKDVRGLGRPEENRTDRDAASGAGPEEVVRDVARIEIRHDQKIGLTRQAR